MAKDTNSKYRDFVAAADSFDEQEVKALIVECQAGDKKAFNEIVRRYRKQVTALAYKMTRDYDEAADIAQNVFLKMSANLWRYDPRKKFYTWLYRITVNASIDHIRKHQRHKHEQLDDFRDIRENTKACPEFTYHKSRLRDHMSEAARSLSDKQRTAFTLRDIEGCKVDDVAEIMDMPQATVRWYLHRARVRIRKELLRRCPHLLAIMGLR